MEQQQRNQTSQPQTKVRERLSKLEEVHSQEVAACVSAHSCTVLKDTMMLRPGEVQATVLLMHQTNSQGYYSNVDSFKHTVDMAYGTCFTALCIELPAQTAFPFLFWSVSQVVTICYDEALHDCILTPGSI